MKTICFVVPGFPKPTQTFVVNQIIAAKRQGWNVKILVKSIWDITKSSQEALIHSEKLMDNVLLEEFHVPKQKWKHRFKAILLILRFFKFWFVLIKEEPSFKYALLQLPFEIAYYKRFTDIDVFHVQFAVPQMRLAKMKKAGVVKGKVITTFHGYDAHYSTPKALLKLKKDYSDLLKISTHITVNTPFLEEQVLNLGEIKSKTTCIPMGVSVNDFKVLEVKHIKKDGLVKLLSVGRLIDFKGFNYAIQSVQLLVNQGFDVKYTIVGEGELKSNLQKLIDDLGLGEHVFLVGRQTQSDIKTIMRTHHIYLMSSIIDATGRGETQGVVTAEAQAMGLPVVAFNCGGVPYTVKDKITGVLVPEKNIKMYAEAIVFLSQNPEKYTQMSEAAIKYVNHHFSTEIMGSRFAALYN